MFQIGAFARLAGVSAKQLRAYDEIGLFRPVWVDPSSAYRYYSPAQLPELRRVLALRQLGMPLEEIRHLAAGGDLARALERRRAELELERRRVEERLAALEISVADDAAIDVVVRPVMAELVAIMLASGSVGEDFYALESYVRDLGRRAHRPPGALPETREIFVPLTAQIVDSGRITTRRLPAAQVASVIHRGDYGGIAPARRRLEGWVDAAGLRRAGPIRTVYLQFGAESDLRLPPGWVVERDAEFVTELQVPVA
jgi:DNA-binding transcriptional MerR regulator